MSLPNSRQVVFALYAFAIVNSSVSALDSGCSVYVADASNNRVRTINVSTDPAIVSTLAGNGTDGYIDGRSNSAMLSNPFSAVASPDGLSVYVAEYYNNRIRVIKTNTGVVSTLAGSGQAGFLDGSGAQATFTSPKNMAVSPDGRTVYVTSQFSQYLRRIDVASANVSTLVLTLAGNTFWGFQNGVAMFMGINGVAASPDGRFIYVSEVINHLVRRIDIETGTVSTLAGDSTALAAGFADGPGASAQFRSPAGVGVSRDGATVYVCDSGNHRIRAINAATGAVTTLAGNGTAGYFDGIGSLAMFNSPNSVGTSLDGAILYIADTFNLRIRSIRLANLAVSTVAGSGVEGFNDGAGTQAAFSKPYSVYCSPAVTTTAPVSTSVSAAPVSTSATVDPVSSTATRSQETHISTSDPSLTTFKGTPASTSATAAPVSTSTTAAAFSTSTTASQGTNGGLDTITSRPSAAPPPRRHAGAVAGALTLMAGAWVAMM
jgi:sugar lactone lactonase YvrE